MKTIKQYGLLVFMTPFFILFLIFIGLLVLFKARIEIVDELAAIYQDIILKNKGFLNKRQNELFDMILDIAIHTSMIFWIALLVFLLP